MDPYLGEIRLFSFGQIPQGWAACEGQVMAIQQNQALFSLLGTAYGGNGVNTFALPDLRGRVPLHFTSAIALGAKGGEETHTLTTSEMPQHVHQASGSGAAPTPDISGAVWGQQPKAYGPAQSLVAMSTAALATAGASQPHQNMQPYLAMTFCIATQGIYPSRN
ncbi:MAG: phage tail protein [Telluria sp.]